MVVSSKRHCYHQYIVLADCYCFGKYPDSKPLWEERVYLPNSLYYIKKGSEGRNSKQKPGGGNRSRDHGGMLLVALLQCLLFCFSYTIQNHLPLHGIAHSGLDTPTSNINQENTSTDLPTSRSDGGSFSIEAPSSLPRLYQVGKNPTNTQIDVKILSNSLHYMGQLTTCTPKVKHAAPYFDGVEVEKSWFQINTDFYFSNCSWESYL